MGLISPNAPDCNHTAVVVMENDSVRCENIECERQCGVREAFRMYPDVGMEHGNNDNCIIVTDPRENISPH